LAWRAIATRPDVEAITAKNGKPAMQKGRNYCYDLSYYGPTAWFWPGYFPWKFKLEVLSTPPPPWDIFTFSDRVSFPAIWQSDRELVRYIFTTTLDVAHLELQMYTSGVHPHKHGIWRMLLTQGVIGWGDYRHLEDAPLTRLSNSVWELDFNFTPYTSYPSPPYLVRPAVWSESGQHPLWH
jgi:hypothetical protein